MATYVFTTLNDPLATDTAPNEPISEFVTTGTFATVAKSKALGHQWGQSFSSLVRYLVKEAFEDALKALGGGNQTPRNSYPFTFTCLQWPPNGEFNLQGL